jgi:hypothetical protein
MLLRLGEISAALQAFGAMSDDQRRQSSLADAVMGMIERGEISNAKLVTAELYKAALRAADDNARSAQLRYAAGFEARLGFFRTAKQFCEECNRFDKLAVDRSILTFYEARSHPLVRRAVAESDNRSLVDWIY